MKDPLDQGPGAGCTAADEPRDLGGLGFSRRLAKAVVCFKVVLLLLSLLLLLVVVVL